MQEDDLKTVKITIAGRVFPVKVTPEEDLIVRDLEEEINSKVNDFQHTYPGRGKLDFQNLIHRFPEQARVLRLKKQSQNIQKMTNWSVSRLIK